MSKFEHIKDSFIKESLEEYKDVIDKNKPDALSVSEYKVLKPWGYELWLELNLSIWKREIDAACSHTNTRLKQITLLRAKQKCY